MANPGAPGFPMSNFLTKNATMESPACECGDKNAEYGKTIPRLTAGAYKRGRMGEYENTKFESFFALWATKDCPPSAGKIN